MSLNWEAFPFEVDTPVGEIYTGPPKWSNGATPPTARGQHWFGDPQLFKLGQPWDANGPIIPRDPFGLASACTGLQIDELDDLDASVGISAEGDD
jgi:hypothetical protein